MCPSLGKTLMSVIDSQIERALQALGVDYQIMPCDPAVADTAAFCAHYRIPPEHSINTLLVKAKTGEVRFVACVLLASHRLNVNRTVRKRIGARRVSFASAAETKALTGMEIGGVTPIALPESMPIWVDLRVMDAESVILGGGNRHSKIRISPQIFTQLPNTAIVAGLADPINS